MPRKRPLPEKELRCPDCGSRDFIVYGMMDYRQPYNSETREHGEVEVSTDVDWPEYVDCAECDQDMTRLFRQAGLRTEFYKRVRFRGGRT